jgi:hypothetical protein
VAYREEGCGGDGADAERYSADAFAGPSSDVRPIPEILMPHVLHDILRDTSTAQPLSFQKVVLEKRDSPRYERLRTLLSELYELPDADRERTERLLRDEISAMTERARLPFRPLGSAPESWRLQFPDISRYRSAMEPIVGGHLQLESELFRVFPELKPVPETGSQITFDLKGAVVHGDVFGGDKTTLYNGPTIHSHVLAEELARLQIAIPSDGEHASALSRIAEAEAAARAGDGSRAIAVLRTLGTGILEIAKSAGAETVAAILKDLVLPG